MSYDLLRFSLLFNRFVPSGTSPSPDTFHPDPTQPQHRKQPTNHPTHPSSLPREASNPFLSRPPEAGTEKNSENLRAREHGPNNALFFPSPGKQTSNPPPFSVPPSPEVRGWMGRKKKLEICTSMGAWSSKLSICFAKPPNHQTKAPQTKYKLLTLTKERSESASPQGTDTLRKKQQRMRAAMAAFLGPGPLSLLCGAIIPRLLHRIPSELRS